MDFKSLERVLWKQTLISMAAPSVPKAGNYCIRSVDITRREEQTQYEATEGSKIWGEGKVEHQSVKYKETEFEEESQLIASRRWEKEWDSLTADMTSQNPPWHFLPVLWPLPQLNFSTFHRKTLIVSKRIIIAVSLTELFTCVVCKSHPRTGEVGEISNRPVLICIKNPKTAQDEKTEVQRNYTVSPRLTLYMTRARIRDICLWWELWQAGHATSPQAEVIIQDRSIYHALQLNLELHKGREGYRYRLIIFIKKVPSLLFQ